MTRKKPVKKTPQKIVIPEKSQRDFSLIFLLIMIAFISIVRYRLLGVALERDEGEYAYIGNLFLNGVGPFNDGYSMKLPGTPFMYAVFMFIFGRSGTGIHTGLLFMNAGTMYLLYASFKKIFNSFIGLTTATIYGFMAIGLPFIGFAAHATHFICFYTSFALWFLARYMKSGKPIQLFLIGLMLGMAFLMKQQAVFMIAFIALFLFIYLRTEKKKSFWEIIRKLMLFGVAVVIPYIIVFLIIVATGQFRNFWLWTVQYASLYEGVKGWDSIKVYFESSFIPAWTVYYYLWLLALAGIMVLFWSPYTRLQKIFATGYLIASTCMVCAGFYFRPHYYVVILPVIGLLFGILIEFLIKRLKEHVPVLKSPYTKLLGLFFLVIIQLFGSYEAYRNYDYFFRYSTAQICDRAYWGNPFSEVPAIAKFIKENTADTDKMAILGSEPEMYFYANRRAATGYLYTYPLVDEQPNNEFMQKQMIAEIEKNKPTIIIFCNLSYSWVVHPGTPRDIFDWGNAYTHDHYTPIAFVDFFKDKGWYLFSGDAIKTRTQQPNSFIIIFKRNPDNPPQPPHSS